MPLDTRGSKALWFFSGVFLCMGGLVIIAPAQAVPVAICFPALYTIWSARSRGLIPSWLAWCPLMLAAVPAFREGAMLCACLLLCGLVLERSLLKGRITAAVAVPTLIVSGAIVVSLLVGANAAQMGPRAMVADWVHSVMDEVVNFNAQMLDSGELMDFKMRRAGLEERLVNLYPGCMITSVLLLFAWVNALAAARSLRVQLSSWELPDAMVLVFILSAAATLVPQHAVRVVGMNALIVVAAVYFLQGMAIVTTFFRVRGWHPLWRGIIYVLIFFQVYMMIAISGLGLFDTWLQLRKKIRKGDEA